MEDLPLGIIAALVLEFVVNDLPLGRTLMILYCIALYYIVLCYYIHHQSVLPKGRFFTANSDTKAASSAQSQVFYRKLRNQGCSFTRDE